MDWSQYGIKNPYYSDDAVCIVHADCRDILPLIPDKSIDLVLTDPPYGIGFMGKSWDKALPDKEIWQECLRVLKDGAFAFVMSIPRQDCLMRMIGGLEEAGFNVGFTPIYWCFASGFPKAQNIGKAVDKKKGTHPDKSREFALFIKTKRLELNIGLTKADEYVCGSTTNYSWFEGRPAGQRLPRLAEYKRIKELLQLDNCFDDYMGEAEREVIGIERERTSQNWCPTSQDNNTYITKPATPQAKALDGSYGGFQPKPAVEVIIVAMKPLSEKTYVDQALKNRKGITWLDDGRIPFNKQDEPQAGERTATFGTQETISGGDGSGGFDANVKGRFPANLLVSDDVLNDGRDYKTGDIRQGLYKDKPKLTVNCYGDYGAINNNPHTGDSGSFSRYFDLDAFFDKLLDKLKSKAYNRDKNIGGALWEINQAEDKSGLKNNSIPATGAVDSSPIMPATEPSNIISALNPVMLNSDLADQNPDVKSAEEKLGYTETDIAQRLAQIKLDTETLLQILENEATIPTTQNKPSLFSQNAVNYVVSKLKDLRDTIQISIDQPRLFGSVIPVIIEQMRQDLSQDQLWQNFWQERVKLLSESQQRTFPFAIISKASKSEKNKYLDKKREKLPWGSSNESGKMYDNGSNPILAKNTHPTVKPLKLMSYLISLGSREGDTVLDPFLGSGTTALACKLMSRKTICCEIEEKYCEIAAKRCSQTVMALNI